MRPLREPVTMPEQKGFDLTPAPELKWLGPLVIVLTLALYVIFR
jgi:hypothetical protein